MPHEVAPIFSIKGIALHNSRRRTKVYVLGEPKKNGTHNTFWTLKIQLSINLPKFPSHIRVSKNLQTSQKRTEEGLVKMSRLPRNVSSILFNDVIT